VLVVLAFAVATPASAVVASKGPTKRHTAADMRLARSIALRRADLPAGWTREKSSGSSGDADCSAMPDESKLIETGTVDPTFDSHGGALSLDSEVDVYATKAMALVDWRSANLRLLRSCLAELFAKMTSTHVTVTAAAMPVSVHAERALAYRFELSASGGAPYDIDLVAFGKGRTTVLLSVDGPKGSFSSSLLAPFARLLAQRLTKSAS
jgi:hypothetical protein